MEISGKKPEEQMDEHQNLEAVQEAGEFEINTEAQEENLDHHSFETALEDAEVEQLVQELEEARLKVGEYLDGWQRARAEFANYKKRKDREQADLNQTISGMVAKQYLDVVGRLVDNVKLQYLFD